MKKRRKKLLCLVSGLLIFFVLIIAGYKIYNSYEYTSGGTILNKEINYITFDSKYSNFYYQLSIDNKNALQINIPYKVINPQGVVEEEGVLINEEKIEKKFSNSKGTWKIEFEPSSEENSFLEFKFVSSALKVNLK